MALDVEIRKQGEWLFRWRSFLPIILIPLIDVLAFWLYYERIMFAEEAFLRQKFGETYQRLAATTPAFFPRFGQWRKPSLPFSWRNVMRREYTALMLLILCHAGQEFIER